MRQGLDVADVEERTKIRAKYLRALENEEWHSLPGPTFVKTFLRTYAELLGLDPHLLVDEYRATHLEEEADLQPLATPPAAVGRAERSRARPPGPPRPAALLVLAGVVMAGVVIVGVLLALGLSADEDPPSRQAADERPRARQERPAAQPRPRPAGVVMRVAPEVPTYACVDTGAGTDVVFEGTLDEPRAFRNPRRLRINLGKRSVSLRANGRPVQIEESPDPIGLEVTRAGAQEIVEGPTPCG